MYASSRNLTESPAGQWNRCGYGNFSIFKMEAVRHLGSLKVQNLNCRSGSEGHCLSVCLSVMFVCCFAFMSTFVVNKHMYYHVITWRYGIKNLPQRDRATHDASWNLVRHHTKCRADRWNRCRGMAIFVIFSRWRPSAILDLFYTCLSHPRSVLGGLYRCAKFGWNYWWTVIRPGHPDPAGFPLTGEIRLRPDCMWRVWRT